MGLAAGVAITAVVALVAGVAGYLWWRSRTVPPPESDPTPAFDDTADREARHQVVEEHGTELLERRVDLDARRGTLGGDSQVLDAFEQLDARFRRGDITSDEYETEKIRLLGG